MSHLRDGDYRPGKRVLGRRLKNLQALDRRHQEMDRDELVAIVKCCSADSFETNLCVGKLDRKRIVVVGDSYLENAGRRCDVDHQYVPFRLLNEGANDALHLHPLPVEGAGCGIVVRKAQRFGIRGSAEDLPMWFRNVRTEAEAHNALEVKE